MEQQATKKKITQEAKALHYIGQWVEKATTTPKGDSEYLSGYRAGLQTAKDVVWAIIKANIKPKKK